MSIALLVAVVSGVSFGLKVKAAPNTIFTTQTPATSVSTDSSAVELGLKFKSDVNGSVTGVRFYKGGTGNGGVHYGHLWSSTGTKLAQVKFVNETSSGWQKATFSSPVNITANTVYIASYYAPKGQYSYTSQGLANGIDNPPLHALANSVSPNGVYAYTTTSTGAFPSSSYNATNYFVDVDFTPATQADTTAPTVNITAPANNATVSGTTSLTASASDASGVASVQYYLDGTALGSPITTSPYTYNWDTTTATNASHTLTAKATDTSGNVGTSSSVTVTVSNVVTPPVASVTTIWPSSATPLSADANDTGSVNLGVKFQSSTDGYITGLRFYKGNNNNGGTHVGSLWSADGTLLAQATFINESASGWQTVAFSTGVPITANVTYVASYLAPTGHYSYDTNGLANAVTNAPLTALSSAASGGNGVYAYSGTSTFPTGTYNATNYWIDVFFSTSNTPPDTTAPTVSITAPANNATVSGTTSVTASASDASGVASVQYYLDGVALGSPITTSPYTYSWDTTTATNATHTLTAKAIDANGNSATSSNVTVTVSNAVTPRAGVRGSGPLLVLTDPTNPYSDDYCDALLKTEGIPSCAATDSGNLTSSFSLSGYRTIVLADGSPLTSAQVSQISSWVTNGGTFIAMRPNDNLDSLLGIGQKVSTLNDAYYQVDSTKMPGIETQTMQFHGAADNHALAGAQAMATLYSNATTATTYPAVTTNTVGSGKAIAYMFDVSKSVLLTRNGNPSLAGQVTVSTDGLPRFVDRFGGGWLDTSKASIPQADELQRSLANIVIQATTMPRLWYFPAYNGGFLKAAIILTGDDHNSSSQTISRFAAESAASPAGCSVADWTCYTSTSYAYPGSFSDTDAKQYTDKGFEVSLHANDSGACISGWSTQAQLDTYFANALTQWQTAFPSINASQPPLTERFHCYGIWKDYASVPLVEAKYGIIADNNSPCWPNAFLNVGQCLFTGAGMPLSYSDASGKLTGVYQFTTHATDENANTISQSAMNTLVTNAYSKGYYGYFTVLCHLDNLAISNQCATDILSVAQTNNVPMISARLAAQFWDGRNKSTISSISYGTNTLSYSVNSSVANMQQMTPISYGSKTLSGLTINGATATYSTQTIDGIQYAIATVPQGAASLVATYQ